VKLHRLRNLALGLIFFAFFMMYLGMFVKSLLPVFLLFGTFCLLVSVTIYFRMGALSMKIPQVICPSCLRTTKVLGREDGCMYCRAPIRLEEHEIAPTSGEGSDS
jgi:hypothetical protein